MFIACPFLHRRTRIKGIVHPKMTISHHSLINMIFQACLEFVEHIRWCFESQWDPNELLKKQFNLKHEFVLNLVKGLTLIISNSEKKNYQQICLWDTSKVESVNQLNWWITICSRKHAKKIICINKYFTNNLPVGNKAHWVLQNKVLFGTTSGWVNDRSFVWTLTLNTHLIIVLCYYR